MAGDVAGNGKLSVGIGVAEQAATCFLNVGAGNGCAGLVNDRKGDRNGLLSGEKERCCERKEERKAGTTAEPKYATGHSGSAQRHRRHLYEWSGASEAAPRRSFHIRGATAPVQSRRGVPAQTRVQPCADGEARGSVRSLRDFLIAGYPSRASGAHWGCPQCGPGQIPFRC